MARVYIVPWNDALMIMFGMTSPESDEDERDEDENDEADGGTGGE